MKWVSCRQHIYGSYFCINAASLCVLVGAFNPFTFKVIINMSDPIIILLIVLSLFFVRSFPSLVFPAQRTSFSICCKAGLVVLDSLNFCLSGKLLISLSHLNESLAGWSILGCSFFPFIAQNISCKCEQSFAKRIHWSQQTSFSNNIMCRDDFTHGYHQMVSIEIRLIIFFAAEDGEAIYSHQKECQELSVAHIMNSLL